MADVRYVREKLHDATVAISNDQMPLLERLKNAYVFGLSNLEASHFPDADGRAEFMALKAAFNSQAEVFEGEGSMPTTVQLIDEADALRLAAGVVALARRYDAAG